MGKRKRDSPGAELRRALLECLRDPETQRDIANALIRSAVGEGKGVGDIIKSYEKITEIVSTDMRQESGSLSDQDLARRSTAELRAMLDRLQ